ncbi:winged helix-turn-helix domain-containing protein [Pseudotenacibaculum haliotis]|uniref:Winged helix-turn-helix domain-containing protein n=1 Tax=Pseudotenacibaculum haliotis TaxID=1862138 RepID=A0ABW5LM81_9FLAO
MEYKIKSRIWIEIDGKIFLGEGRIKLLKAIQNTGSLSKAARALDMSYKKAWNLIDSVNKASEQAVVIKNTGGKGGGGAEVTSYGCDLIDSFDRINKNCWKFLDKQTLVNFP